MPSCDTCRASFCFPCCFLGAAPGRRALRDRDAYVWQLGDDSNSGSATGTRCPMVGRVRKIFNRLPRRADVHWETGAQWVLATTPLQGPQQALDSRRANKAAQIDGRRNLRRSCDAAQCHDYVRGDCGPRAYKEDGHDASLERSGGLLRASCGCATIFRRRSSSNRR